MLTKAKTKAGRKRSRRIKSESCPVCGNRTVRGSGSIRTTVNGETVSVPSIEHRKCSWCDEVLMDLDSAFKLNQNAAAIYRKKHGLLAADEIRAIREQLGLTQAQLASLLRLGANTISRWESSRNVQSAAMDTVLRLIRDVPGSLEYLKERAA
jgi:HTH-type transcriptional regulator / antitoxin MqsA